MTAVRALGLKRLFASRIALVGLVAVLLVISGLSIQGIVNQNGDAAPAFDPAGDARAVALDGVDPMSRPAAGKGVTIGKPDSVPPRPQRKHAPVKSSLECVADSGARAALELKKGAKVCGASATRQSKTALQAKPLVKTSGRGPIAPPKSLEPSASASPSNEATPEAGTPTDTTSSPSAGTADEGSSNDGAEDGQQPPAKPNPEQQDSQVVIKPASYTPAHQAASLVATISESTPGSYLSPNWTQLTPSTAPMQATEPAMAYDDERNNFVLFGGRTSTTDVSDDTWVWSGTDWVKLTLATKPSARFGAGMAWDPASKKVFLFGGRTATGANLNDVWAWDGTAWSQQTPTGTAPAARARMGFAYDYSRAGFVMFGGSSATKKNDTWQLKNNAWTQLQAGGASGAPTVRDSVSMAYSPQDGQLVLFGGESDCATTCPVLDDTWVLPPTASAWTKMTNPDSGIAQPLKRSGAALTYDPGMKALVLFGGASTEGSTTTLLNDTWAWTGTRWSKAVGVASPGGRSAGAMAADDKGRVLYFGGATVGGNSSETWTYDSQLPLINVEISPADDTATTPTYWMAGDAIKITITAMNVGSVAINGDGVATIVSALDDTVLSAGSEITWGPAGGLPALLDACTGQASVCGGISDLTTNITNLTIPVGETQVGDFVATLVGTQRGCELIDIPATVSSVTGGSNAVFSQITVCGGGLGLENWWTYDTTDLGNGGTASVNAANGNLVVKDQDTSPVQMAGKLQLGLGRAYNSQDVLTGGGPLGAGWQLDLGATGERAGGFGLGSLKLPPVANLTQPLSMPYIDRDGTRHVFKLRSIGATSGGLSTQVPLDGGLGGVLGAVVNGDLRSSLRNLLDSVTGSSLTDICIDEAYSGPKGSNMFLFRYVGVNDNGCGNPNNGAVQIGWSLVRPDRLRYDFNVLGEITAITDPTGQQLLFSGGDEDGAGGRDPYGPEIIKPASCTSGAACPKISIDYDVDRPALIDESKPRRVQVTDSAGRITTYVVTRGAVPRLIQVWEPGNPWIDRPEQTDPTNLAGGARPSWEYTYATSGHRCAGNATDAVTMGQLCSATDADGHTSTFVYAKAPLGPDRVLQVNDRRAGESDGAAKGLGTKYTWHDKTDGAPDFVTADMAAPSTLASGCGTTCERIRYSKIDAYGRVGVVEEGATNPSVPDGGTFLRQSANFWDGGIAPNGIASCSQPSGAANHNLCQTIRKAVPTSDPILPGDVHTGSVNGVTVHDEASDYEYGDLGQVLRKKVLLDAAANWTDDNSAITTYGTTDQYFDANGDRRLYNNHVMGNGAVSSTGIGDGYPDAVKDDEPAAYWRLDEQPGATVMHAAVGPDGSFAAGTLGVGGPITDNTAFKEPAGGSTFGAYVSSLSGFAHGTAASDSDFTVETWQKTTDTTPEYAVSWGTPDESAIIGRLSGGVPSIVLNSAPGTTEQAVAYGTYAINDGQWHHVVYTYNGNGHTSGMEIWVDGVQQPLTSYADNLNGEFAPVPAPAKIGLDGSDSSLDEIALYPQVLTGSQIKRHMSATTGARIKAGTLYAVTDQTQQLSPRGNESGANWGEFLTTTRRDIPAPGATEIGSTNLADGPVCQAGDTTPGNSGLTCEIDTAASNGVGAGDCKSPVSDLPAGSPAAPVGAGYASTCSTYQYNATGQRTKMQTPKSHATGGTSYDYTYYDTVTSCAGVDRANCDLSGTVTAGGWLKAVTDPAGEKTIFAHDATGNVARTWERNATHGKALSDSWTDPAAAPSQAFTDQVNSTPVTSDSLSVSTNDLITVGPDGTTAGTGVNSLGELGDGTTASRSSTPAHAQGLTNVVAVAQTTTGQPHSCYYTLFLTGDGEVYQAGGGVATPVKLNLKDIISIAAGGCHFLALDADGHVFAWGTNTFGQVGNGATTSVANPVMLTGIDGVSTIAAGYTHSLAVTTDGSVWAWGRNTEGQLGTGNNTDSTSPAKISSLKDARSLAAGEYSSYAIDRAGKVWAWGSGQAGGLGLGNTNAVNVPTLSGNLGAGTSVGAVRQIVAGGQGAVALAADGKAWAWGVNDLQQLGQSRATALSPVQVPGVDKQVAIAGGVSTYATADAAGKITVWGYTGGYQRADGSAASPSAPTTSGVNISPYRLPGWQVRGSRDATGNLATQTTDRLGNVRRFRPARGNEVYTAAYDKTSGYDAADRPVWANGAQHRAAGARVSVVYDPFGNPVKRVDARGFASLATFDAVNRQVATQVTRAAGDEAPASCTGTAASADWTAGQSGMKICTTSFTFDGLGRTVTSTDANSQVTRSWSDAAGRETRRDVPRNDATHTWLTSRTAYDKNGAVIRQCSPEQDVATQSCPAMGKYSTQFIVNRAGLMAKEVRYRDTTELDTSFDFDADGNTTAITDPNGHTTTQSYDLQDRRKTRTVPRSDTRSFTTSWTYDPSGNVVTTAAPGSLNAGTGADGNLVVDGTTAASSTDGAAHSSSNPFKIPDGAQYRNVTLKNGGYVTANAANGLLFKATGTVDVCATCVITMAGKGYAGGAGNQSAANPNPGNGGLKGAGGALAGAGGGGGGHKNAGSPGGTNNSNPAGLGGLVSGNDAFSTVGSTYLNGSGGGGGGGGFGLLGSAGAGGNGGGYIRITADTIVVNGTITAAGANGANGGSNTGGGGGGAGGGIWLTAATVTLANQTVLKVSGGTGGAGSGASGSNPGGAGSVGRIRIDADEASNTPVATAGASMGMITAVSYDAANRPLDTVEGAQVTEADPTKENSGLAAPDADGVANTRTRAYYNADGVIAAMLPPTAFSDAASLTAPNRDVTRRMDYDLDGQVIRSYSPRYSDTVASLGAGNDGAAGTNQQTAQCTAGRTVDYVAGAGSYGSTVGVCVTRTAYDANGNVATQWLPTSNGADNRRLEYDYTPDGLAREVKGPDPSDPTSSTLITVNTARYDAVGRPTWVKDALGNVTQTSYFADGLTRQSSAQAYTVNSSTEGAPADETSSDPTLVTEITKYEYDANGNQTKLTNPEGKVTSQTWTTDGLLDSHAEPGNSDGTATTEYVYDQAGNPIKVFDPEAQQRKGESIGPKPVVNTFTSDNLLSYSNAPVGDNSYRSVHYKYSPAGVKTSSETALCASGNPDDCTTSAGAAVWQSSGLMQLTYGANGRVVDQSGRGKSVITTAYTQDGMRKRIADSTSLVTITAGYYLDGRLRTTDDGTNQNTYAYDGAGQTTVRSDQTAAAGVTAGAKVTTSYAYASTGLPAAMDSEVLDQVTNYTFDKAGRLDKATTGSHVSDYSWHPDNSLAGVQNSFGASAKSSYVYRYDRNRNITSQTVTGAGATYTNTYDYWPGQQVKTWNHDGTADDFSVYYEFDRNNNRTLARLTANGAQPKDTTWTYRRDNSIDTMHLPADATHPSGQNRVFAYNEAGLQTSDGCVTTSYDDFDRIAKVVAKISTDCGSTDARTTTFSYDGLDRQRSSTVANAIPTAKNDSTGSIYDGLSNTVVGQKDAVSGTGDAPEVMYQLDPMGDEIAYEQTGSDAHKAFLDTDGLGNVTSLITSTTGDNACTVVYDPWGGAVDALTGSTQNGMCTNEPNVTATRPTTTGNAIWYRGTARNGSTGYYQLGARTYNPGTGAFTAPDAYRVSSPSTDLSVGVDPLTANSYAYVNGNPLNAWDPTGHRSEDGTTEALHHFYVEPLLSGKPHPTRRDRRIEAQYKQIASGIIREERHEQAAADYFMSTYNAYWAADQGSAGACGWDISVGRCGRVNAYGRFLRDAFGAPHPNELQQGVMQDAMLRWEGGGAQEDWVTQMVLETVASAGLLSVKNALMGGARATLSAAGIRLGSKAVVREAVTTTVYRGTENTLELMIHAETGHLLSDAARVGYREGGSLLTARAASEMAHSEAIRAWGSIGDYVMAHGAFGTELAQIGVRSMISVTTDINVAKRFAGAAGRVFSAEVESSTLIPQTLSGATESEFLIPHLVRAVG